MHNAQCTMHNAHGLTFLRRTGAVRRGVIRRARLRPAREARRCEGRATPVDGRAPGRVHFCRALCIVRDRPLASADTGVSCRQLVRSRSLRSSLDRRCDCLTRWCVLTRNASSRCEPDPTGTRRRSRPHADFSQSSPARAIARPDRRLLRAAGVQDALPGRPARRVPGTAPRCGDAVVCSAGVRGCRSSGGVRSA